MAGSSVEAPRQKSVGRRKKKIKRIGVRIDMTPLVDVAFLLLTFFMLTTSLSRPQSMEVNIPPDEGNVPVRDSNLMTVYVSGTGELFWRIGMDEFPVRERVEMFRQTLRDKFAANRRLIAFIKIDPKAKYETLVNILDDLAVVNIQRYSIGKMDDKDQALIGVGKTS